MNSIARLITICGGIKNLHAIIQNPPYLRLVLEDIRRGPRGFPAISVAHYDEQNGDLCQDPEIGFKLVPQSGRVAYEPYLFQQAVPAVYQEVLRPDLMQRTHGSNNGSQVCAAVGSQLGRARLCPGSYSTNTQDPGEGVSLSPYHLRGHDL